MNRLEKTILISGHLIGFVGETIGFVGETDVYIPMAWCKTVVTPLQYFEGVTIGLHQAIESRESKVELTMPQSIMVYCKFRYGEDADDDK